MLQQKSIYFARADLLGDPYEGYYTKAGKQLIPQFAERHAKEVFSTDKRKSLEEHTAFFTTAYEFIHTLSVKDRTNHFISCWHMNERESSAMWKLYTSLSDAVCIKTTYAKLASCLPDDALLGVIRYIDYDTQFFNLGNGFNYLMHKRESFSHEREARAILWIAEKEKDTHPERRIGEVGLKVSVDLSALIEAVYISPDARAPLLEVIQTLLVSHGLTAPVLQSEVNAPPAY